MSNLILTILVFVIATIARILIKKFSSQREKEFLITLADGRVAQFKSPANASDSEIIRLAEDVIGYNKEVREEIEKEAKGKRIQIQEASKDSTDIVLLLNGKKVVVKIDMAPADITPKYLQNIISNYKDMEKLVLVSKTNFPATARRIFDLIPRLQIQIVEKYIPAESQNIIEAITASVTKV